MTEQERLKAIPILNDWKRMDDTVRDMVMTILLLERQESVGHLARFRPEIFDELYDEASAIIDNPT